MRHDEPRLERTSLPITRTSERGGKGDCVKGGGGEEGKRVKGREREVRRPWLCQCYSSTS
jgi:hypothetical protein